MQTTGEEGCARVKRGVLLSSQAEGAFQGGNLHDGVSDSQKLCDGEPHKPDGGAPTCP